MAIPQAYNDNSISVLEGLAAIRKRPSMFIGSVDVDGYHHLVWEVVDNALDEAMAGFCKRILVQVNADEQVLAIQDDGRGIPTGMHPTEGIPTIDVVFTKLHAGGKFQHDSYKVSGGLHGVGVKCVNALSEWVDVLVVRDGTLYRRRYEHGEPTKPTLDERPAKGVHSGTRVVFRPDQTMFHGCRFERQRLERRLRELAFLNPGLELRLRWSEEGQENDDVVFASTTGLAEYVQYLANGKTALHPPLRLKSEVPGCAYDLSLLYTGDYDTAIHSFCNNVATPEGGVHLNAAVDSLAKVLSAEAERQGLLKGLDLTVGKADVDEGLVLAVSVLVAEPQFGGQTKTRLGNSDLRGPLGDVMQQQLAELLEKDRPLAKILAEKVVDTMRARDAAHKARNLARKKSLMSSAGLSGKLADCSCRDPARRELILAEGDSAAGGLKAARDRETQAVMPLRGKVLNVEKTTLNRALDNKEIGYIISALGVNVTERECDLADLRYHKVILMTDADQDGGHICCLLLAFFHRYMRKLIENGHLYICDLPLYAVKLKGHTHYLKDDAALNDFRDTHKGAKLEVSRFKGLGEMSVEELEETATNTLTRRLRQIVIEDDTESAHTLDALMGGDVVPRKEFLARELSFT